MSGEQPVNPCTVPTFTGDLEALEQDYAAMKAAAGTFRDAGANVDSEFQGLSAFYSAPEAAQLFATTQPVRTDSDFFADQLDSAAKALGEYVSEARPIAARLKELQARAAAFSDKISGDEHWKDDKKKTDENSGLIRDISAAVAAFWAAERACADKLRALHGEPPLRYDDGSHGKDMYGYRLEDLNASKSLPWGTQFDQTHRWYEIDHWVKSFVWDGIVVDGIVGTVRGLGTLFGYDGSDKAGQAWTGLAKLGTGLALTIQPGMGVAYWTADDKELPAWLRDSRKAMKETGKALVAWDEWGKNPARAAGGVTFNVITAIFTEGAGTAAKTGTVAKAIATAGKVGKLIDPMTYVFKAGSYTFSKLKVGELFAKLTTSGDAAFPKPDDVTWKEFPKAQLPPGARLPHPADTMRLPDDALGRPQYFDKITNQLLDHTGFPKQDLTTVPKGVDHPLAETPERQQATVGAPTTHTTAGIASPSGGMGRQVAGEDGHLGRADGRGSITQPSDQIRPGIVDAHSPAATIGANGRVLAGVGGDVPGPGHAVGTAPMGPADTSLGGHAPDNMPRNSVDAHAPSTGGSRPDTPSSGGHAEVRDGADHNGGPSGPDSSGHHEPSPAGGTHPEPLGVDNAPHTDSAAAHRAEYEAAREKPAKERTAEEAAAVTREHVRLANEDPAWFEKHYRDADGHRHDKSVKADGADLPILKKAADGRWVAKYDMPHGPSETVYEAKELGPETVPSTHQAALDSAAANRRASVDLINADKAFKDGPSAKTRAALEKAHNHYEKLLRGVPNNSKISETLGEQAAALHVIPNEFTVIERIDLPKTPNGANMFDLAYRLDGGEHLIVEAKAPSGDLDWRQGRADPEDPENPHVGDDGGAQGMRVKQGTRPYVRTIFGEMTARGGDDAKIATELRNALKLKKLKFVLVKALDHTDSTYAGARIEYLDIN
ncbi:hypothetical protein [Streptomyces sp. NPDC096033]|uniref:hypothetical protein n=1 Tax=Streptomyces sp. NPDC096033 TaxID=3366071 RepID=UPI003826C621